MKLDDLRQLKAAALDKLSDAAQALQRGRQYADDANAKVKRLDDIQANAQADAAQALADAIANGKPIQPRADNSLSMLHSARADADIASKAVATLEAAHSERVRELSVAHTALVAEVDRILDDEYQSEVLKAIAALDTAIKLTDSVRARMPGGWNMPVNHTAELSVDEQRLVDFAMKMEADNINVPVHILADYNTQRAAELAARRASLIAGELGSESATQAA